VFRWPVPGATDLQRPVTSGAPGGAVTDGGPTDWTSQDDLTAWASLGSRGRSEPPNELVQLLLEAQVGCQLVPL